MNKSTPHFPTLPKTTISHRKSSAPAPYSQRSEDTTPLTADSSPFMLNLTASTPSSLKPGSISTRRTKSDERPSRSKWPIRSSGSPIRQRKRRAYSGIPSNGTVDYPSLDHFDQPRNEPVLPSSGFIRPETEPRPPVHDKEPVRKVSARMAQEKLQQELYKNISENDNRGYVYVLRDRNRPGVVKIGSSIQPEQRQSQIRAKCNINPEKVFTSGLVNNCLRVERLAQHNLSHFQSREQCKGCSRFHREWYKVKEEVAKKTVERWENFMQQQPYNSAGELKGLWKHLFDKRRHSHSSNGTLGLEPWCGHLDDALVPPVYLDHLEYVYSIGWYFLWTFPWQASSVLSGALLCLALRNTTSLFLFYLSIYCSSIYVVSHRTHTKKGKRIS